MESLLIFQRAIFSILFPIAIYQLIEEDDRLLISAFWDFLTLALGYFILACFSIIPAFPAFLLDIKDDNTISTDEVIHITYFGLLIVIELVIINYKTGFFTGYYNSSNSSEEKNSK